jgi:hypothetical protein
MKASDVSSRAAASLVSSRAGGRVGCEGPPAIRATDRRIEGGSSSRSAAAQLRRLGMTPRERSAFILHPSCFRDPCSWFLVPGSSFLVPRSWFLVPCPAFILHPSSFILPRSVFRVPRSSIPLTPLPDGGPSRREAGRGRRRGAIGSGRWECGLASSAAWRRCRRGGGRWRARRRG